MAQKAAEILFKAFAEHADHLGWFEALLAAALDETHGDVAQAIQVAEKALEEHSGLEQFATEDQPRGKTVPGTNAGSFAPKGGSGFKPVHSAGAGRRFAQKLGIKNVIIPNKANREALNHALQALHEISAQGGSMPEGLSFDEDYFAGDKEDSNGEYDPHSQTIHINPNAKYFRDKAYRETQFESGFLSTDDPLGPIYHEYAHHVIRKTLGIMLFGTYQNADAANPLVTAQSPDFLEAADEVGSYATVSLLEFLSEVFAGLKTKKTFSPQVMKVYNIFAPAELVKLTEGGE